MIHLAGYFGTEVSSGWARHVHGFASSLEHYEPVRRSNWSGPVRTRIQTAGYELIRRFRLPLYGDIGVAVGPAELTPCVPGRIRVAYTAWETTRIPRLHVRSLQKADMIWTPSRWGQRVLESAGFPSRKLRVVPEGVDTGVFVPPKTGKKDGTVFRFLCVGKWEQRKAPAELVRAFCSEFDRSEPVELVMHCGVPWPRPFNFREEIARETARAGGNCPRVIPSDPVALPDLVKLMQRSHAFVLPTRAEAWGLPILEAMACGLPCIVTDYSGLKEFANERNCYLIRVKEMCKVDDAEFFHPQYDWGEWAQPDLEHLRYLLRYVYEHRAEAGEKGRRASRDARRLWTWDQAARTAMDYIRELRAS